MAFRQVSANYQLAVDPALVIPKLLQWGTGFPETTVTVNGGTVSYVCRTTPVWTIIPAILFFPLGLLFLLMKTSAALRASVVALPGGTQISFEGEATSPLIQRLEQLMATARPIGASPPPPPPPVSP